MLELRNVTKVFNPSTFNELVLYRQLDLKVESGEFVTIIGSNGSGKSTLFNIICGSLLPDAGDILVDGNSILKLPEFQRAKRFARIFQDPQLGSSPSLTILENLAIAENKNRRFDLGKAIDDKKIDHFITLLKEFDLGLEEKLNVKINNLSGGQRQALALLMVTMGNPSLLLLDEHTAALDPKTSEKIANLTNRIVKDNNLTALMITHNLRQAIELGDRLLMFHKGKIVLDLNGEAKKSLTVRGLIDKFNSLNMTDELSDAMVFS
ncbi:MAG: ATP-binding cassette domain-containing protein [Erysipelotrichaceae bacterium]|nr:ATP-binding cassette domain-containing protein [Erysipelotrichaceae bacterium]MDD4641875.1 ATP-binding cassette domain-containing protein [Erysipelotrichaceae bacterium]